MGICFYLRFPFILINIGFYLFALYSRPQKTAQSPLINSISVTTSQLNYYCTKVIRHLATLTCTINIIWPFRRMEQANIALVSCLVSSSFRGRKLPLQEGGVESESDGASDGASERASGCS